MQNKGGEERRGNVGGRGRRERGRVERRARRQKGETQKKKLIPIQIVDFDLFASDKWQHLLSQRQVTPLYTANPEDVKKLAEKIKGNRKGRGKAGNKTAKQRFYDGFQLELSKLF